MNIGASICRQVNGNINKAINNVMSEPTVEAVRDSTNNHIWTMVNELVATLVWLVSRVKDY